MPKAPTGLQYLADHLMPSMLQGIMGRWILTKMFGNLKHRGLIPPALEKWLYSPIPDEHPINGNVLKAICNISDNSVFSIENCNVLSAFDGVLPDVTDIDDVLLNTNSVHAEHYNCITYDDTIIGNANRKPGVGEYPLNINERGKDIWDNMYVEFTDEIRRLSNNDVYREWAACIIIYERLCRMNRISPFDGIEPITKSRGYIRRNIIRRIRRGYSQGTVVVQQIETDLSKTFGAIFGDRIRPSTARWKTSGIFIFGFCKKISSKWDNAQRKAVKEYLYGMGFVKAKDGSLIMNPHSRMVHIIRVNLTKNMPSICIEMALMESQAIALTGERNKIDILSAIDTMTKTWMSNGDIR